MNTDIQLSPQELSFLAPHGDLWCLNQQAARRFIANASRDADGQTKRVPRAAGTVAIIPVHGVLTKRGGWGVESVDRLVRTATAAAKHNGVSGLVYSIDSPGGSSFGLKEGSDAIFALRGVKPSVAVADPVAASAALWFGSSVDQFTVTDSGEVGSLGVWSLHVDYSKLLEAEGIKPTFIFAGKHKVDGNPYEPLTDEARANIQEGVDDTYDQFISAMARNRGVTKSKVKAEFGEGRMLLPADALKVGMVDRIASLDDVLEKMRATETKDGSHFASHSESDITSYLCAAWDDKPLPQQAAPVVQHIEALRAKRERERRRAVV